MGDFELSGHQRNALEVLVRLIGMTGVHKRPEQDGAIVLDLLPAEHVVTPWGGPEPFCVKIERDGAMTIVPDELAGITERPDPLTAMRRRLDA